MRERKWNRRTEGRETEDKEEKKQEKGFVELRKKLSFTVEVCCVFSPHELIRLSNPSTTNYKSYLAMCRAG